MATKRTRWQRLRRAATVLLCAWLGWRTAMLLAPKPKLAARFASSTAVSDGNGRLLRLTLAADEQYRLWTPLQRISPALRQATLLYEDQHFYRHPGVNPIALARATRSVFGGGRRVGGSTVTMQLARRLWDIDSRSIGGKLWQMVRALQLEAQYSKDEILEAYLNTVPYGGNVEGAGAAALIYYGKTADKLTLPEALTLAVIPQNPAKRGSFRADSSEATPTTQLAEARAQLFARWLEAHPEAKKDEPLMRMPIQLRTAAELPFLAPHFVDAVLAQSKNGERELATTLDFRLQRLLERQARNYVAQKSRIGIDNAVVMLVDLDSLEVKGLLGSVDWKNEAIGGQVNGALAKRSPGSALKPFVYALGIEQGVIHPATMLRDLPVSFATYSPENFDGKYVGPLSAKDALIRSRNIPALGVAGKLNKPSFYEFLKQAGISRLQPESHYGLGLVLGAGEVTMEELITLYAALGNHGLLRPLRYLKSEPKSEGTRVLSEEATWMVTQLLEDNPRPDRNRGLTKNAVPVSWKTGTSWGFRDAWSVGVFGHYALAVWIGNFSGEGNPAFVGVGAAAPLFFDIVDAIVAEEPGLEASDWPAPRTLRRVAVCAVSGQLPQPSCPHTKMTWFWPGKSPIDACEIHKRVVVEDNSGLRACAATKGATHVEVFEDWSSDMLKLFAEAGLPRRHIPRAAPGCDEGDGAAGVAPRITSPLRGVTYALRSTVGGGEEKLALSSVTAGDAHEVFWFLGREYVGKTRSGGQLFVAPQPGTYLVRAVDDHGRSDARELRVEAAQ